MPNSTPKTIAATMSEGSEWLPLTEIPNLAPRGRLVHSILFSDGRVWDAVNGWRDNARCGLCGGALNHAK